MKSNFEQVMDMPWKAVSELQRLLALPYIRLRFGLHRIAWRNKWRIFGMPTIQRHRGSRIELGTGLELRSWHSSNPLGLNHPVTLATRTSRAIIKIGSDCGLSGATIVAANRVEIGDRVLIGANATIVDTDFHPLDPSTRRSNMTDGQNLPVIIEDDVFIGMNSVILKGVRIGRGSIVSANSVVSRNIPPGMIAAGNPAQVIAEV